MLFVRGEISPLPSFRITSRAASSPPLPPQNGRYNKLTVKSNGDLKVAGDIKFGNTMSLEAVLGGLIAGVVIANVCCLILVIIVIVLWVKLNKLQESKKEFVPTPLSV